MSGVRDCRLASWLPPDARLEMGGLTTARVRTLKMIESGQALDTSQLFSAGRRCHSQYAEGHLDIGDLRRAKCRLKVYGDRAGANVCVIVIGPLGYGRSGESPWLWLIVIGGGVGLYVLGRVRGWPQARTWSDVGDRRFLIGAPWWIQALFLAIVGGGSLDHIATGHYRWYWWCLPVVAWLAFADVVVKRKRAGGE